MISTTQLLISFVICLICAGIGMCLATKRKGIDRDKTTNIGIWVFLGFTSFLLVLMANAVALDWSYVDEVFISVAYSYFMSDAPIFETRK